MNKFGHEAGETVKSVKCLPHKYKDQNWIPSTHIKNPGITEYTWYFGTKVAETPASLGLAGQSVVESLIWSQSLDPINTNIIITQAAIQGSLCSVSLSVIPP